MALSTGTNVIIISVVFSALDFFFLRFRARIRHSSLGIDDWIIVLGMVSTNLRHIDDFYFFYH
jgi:hypothetical protein